MAIVKCPNCGKQISDRSERCTFCNAALIEHQEQEKISVDAIKMLTKENIIGCVSAAIISFAAYNILGLVFSNMASYYIGENAEEAIKYVTFHKLPNIIGILVVEMLFFCLLPLLFKGKAGIGYVAGIILSVIFCIACHFIQITAGTLFPSGREDLADYCTSCLRMNGLSMPLLQGALSLLGYGKKLKKIITSISIMSAVYLILSIILGFLITVVFKFGVMGLGLAQLIAGILVFIIVVASSSDLVSKIK